MTPVIRGNSLYTTVDGPTWDQALLGSESLGGTLAVIENGEENNFVTNAFKNDTGLFLNSVYGGDYAAWIGLTYDFDEGIYVNTLGQEQLYFNWNPTFQNQVNSSYGDVNTTIILKSTSPYVRFEGAWDDSWENQPVPYYRNGIAEIPLNLSITNSSTPTEGAGVFTTSINLSAGTETSGNLAEGAEVYWTVSGITADDLESGALEGSGVITDGVLEIDHSLVEDNDSGESFDVSVFSDAERTQQIGETEEFAIADETPSPIIRGNSLYTIVDGPSRRESSLKSSSLGGTLVVINSEDENQFILDEFSGLPRSPLSLAAPNQIPNKTYSFWIGISDSDEEGVWRDPWGKKIEYTNWRAGDPNNLTIFDQSGEDFATIIFFDPKTNQESGAWNDRSDHVSKNSDQSFTGLAEIPLDLSSNLPAELNEGESFVLNIDLTTKVSSTTYTEGARVWYQIEGVQESDFSNDVALSGSGIIGESGNILLDGATEEGIALNLAADSEDEGETLSISFYSANPDLSVSEPENLVVNGDFEADRLPRQLYNSFTPQGWTTDYGGGPDLIADYHPVAASGVDGQFVELDGSGAGASLNSAISQEIKTVAGVTYTLRFDWSPFRSFLPEWPYDEYLQWGTDSFFVKIDGNEVFNYPGTYAITTESWRSNEIDFTANSNGTVITFGAPYRLGDSHGSGIDNISVTVSHDSYLDMIQIGETASADVIDAVDPITGQLGLPGKVKLKDKGMTPFVLYGNEELEFDLGDSDSLINPQTLGFGSEAGESLFSAASKKKGGIHASYEDSDGDNYLDYVVKVHTADIQSALSPGVQEIVAFADTNGEQPLLFTNQEAVFF